MGIWDDGNKEKIDGESDLNKKKDGESERYERIYGYGVVESVLEKGCGRILYAARDHSLPSRDHFSAKLYIYIYMTFFFCQHI